MRDQCNCNTVFFTLIDCKSFLMQLIELAIMTIIGLVKTYHYLLFSVHYNVSPFFRMFFFDVFYICFCFSTLGANNFMHWKFNFKQGGTFQLTQFLYLFFCSMVSILFNTFAISHDLKHEQFQAFIKKLR